MHSFKPSFEEDEDVRFVSLSTFNKIYNSCESKKGKALVKEIIGKSIIRTTDLYCPCCQLSKSGELNRLTKMQHKDGTYHNCFKCGALFVLMEDK